MKLNRTRGAAGVLGIVVGAVLSLTPGQASFAQAVVDLETNDWKSIGPLAGVCTEDLCRSFVELAKVMDGQIPDVTWLNQRKGTSNPLDMFNNGGSENITVIVRTALYHWEGAPHNSWLHDYYDLQLSPGNPYFLEDEIFSSVYTQGVVGAAIAVRAEAVRRGHTALRERSSLFLQRYWAFLSLGALGPKPTNWIAYNMHGTITKPPGPWWGYNLGLVGRRVYGNGFDGASSSVPGYGLQGLLLAMALQHPNRAVSQDLRISPAYWGGLRAAVKALGYTLDGNGKVNLQSKSIPAAAYGLTGTQRTTLRNFADLSSSNVSSVLAMLGNQGVDHPISIAHWKIIWVDGELNGKISWWGDGSPYSLPGDAKGGPWAMVQAQASSTEFVTRSNEKWGNGGRGTTWKEGGFNSSICAEGALPQLCRGLSSEFQFIAFRVVLTQNGPNCISGC